MPRAARQVDRFDFTAQDVSRVLTSMARLADAEDGWINLVPKFIDREEQATSLRFFTLFSGGGLGATMGTWVPGRRDHNGPISPTVGVTHVMGRRLLGGNQTAVQTPQSWSIEQDHPRRGFVARIPLGEMPDRVLEWLIRTITGLSLPDQIERWRADVYLPIVSKGG